MNRIVEIDIGERTWPMCLTLGVYSLICDRYGSLQEGMKRLDELVKEGDYMGQVDEYTWLLESLLSGGYDRQKGGAEKPPAVSQLLDEFSPGDMVYIQRKVLEAIRAGQSREVGVEAPKNGEAGAEPAPNS